MSRRIDLVGQRFGRLIVIKRIEDKNCKDSKWLCECDCGNEIIAFGTNLKRKRTKSCGCLRSESSSKTH